MNVDQNDSAGLLSQQIPVAPIVGVSTCPLHGELALLGVAVAASTVWEILKTAAVDPVLRRTTVTWAEFLRSQAEAILAMDIVETITLAGQRQYILNVIHHASRRCRHRAVPRRELKLAEGLSGAQYE